MMAAQLSLSLSAGAATAAPHRSPSAEAAVSSPPVIGRPGGPLAEPWDPPFDWSAVDRALGLPDDERLRKHARDIDASHRRQNDRTESWRTPEHRYLGLLGERSAARWLGLPMNLSIKRNGTRANLVHEHYPHTVIDVVTRTLLPNGDFPDLTRRVNPNNPSNVDALVLVVWLGDAFEPWLAGWVSEAEMRQTGRREQFKPGIVNRVLPIGAIHQMEELWTLMHP